MQSWKTVIISLSAVAPFLLLAVILFHRRRRRQKPSAPPLQSESPNRISLQQSRSLLRHSNLQDPNFTWTLLPTLNSPTNSYSTILNHTLRIHPRGTKCSLAKLNISIPGPQLSDAYFEITLEYLQQNGRNDSWKEEEEEEDDEEVFVCVGLTNEEGLSNCAPGSYPGSIGFDSTGRLNLDGINLAPKSEKTRWGEVHKTIGCGFDPNKKTVFFTVDSSLVHVVRCTSEAFSYSLFPAIAANADVWVSVNLGERPFSYSNRPEGVSLSSPLLLEPSPRAGYYEYSREPFSVKWEDLELFEISLSR